MRLPSAARKWASVRGRWREKYTASRNVAAADTLRLQQAEVRRAPAKLDEGSYGRCDGCGGPIGRERLEALPWAAECLRCRARAGRR